MNSPLADCIFLAGIGQLSVLAASALVPVRLNWREEFAKLSPLHAQMYWVYGGYTVMSIIALALICVANAQELATGSRLARSLMLYMLVFWGVRLSLQPVLKVKPHLTTWWLKVGYHILTLLFAYFVGVAAWASFLPHFAATTQ